MKTPLAASRLFTTVRIGVFSFLLLATQGWAVPSTKPLPAALPSVTPSAAPTPSPTPSPTPLPLSLADIAPRSQEDQETLKDFASEAQSTAIDKIRAEHGELSRNIDALGEESAKTSAISSVSLDSLRGLQVSWQKLIATLVEHCNTLGERGRALEAEADKIKGIAAHWNSTLAAAEAKDADAPPDTVKLVREVLYNASIAEVRVKSRQTDVLALQIEFGALLTKASAGQATIDQAINQALKTLLVRDSPPIWTVDARPKPDLAGRMRSAYAEQSEQIRNYLADEQMLLGSHALIFLALSGLFLWLRRLIHQWTEDEPHLKRAAPIFEVPVATALAISFLAMGRRYASAPSLFQAAVAAAALLPTVVILRRVLARRLFPVLYALVIFTLADQVRVATLAFPALNRWLFCVEMAAAAGLFLWLFRAQKRGAAESRLVLGRWMPALCAVAVAIFGAALAATIIGNVRLGAYLGTAALQSAYCAVFFYAALRVLEGLIVIALRVRPVSSSRIAQTHRDAVQAQVYTIFRAAAVLAWLWYTLEQLRAAQPLAAATKDYLTRQISLGELHFSLDRILWFVAAIWLSLIISRLLRFFLNEEVYERVQLAPGLPYAISTMLNYVVLVVGFLVALGLLGIQLTQITIVAGAFSVGLGFGLQNIINNFVSGIILLFERPVKVGDVIQLGDATGEVRRIGIRASIIRTRDGSDIILPNGNLISNEVTNWTYSDRCRAVEITLNIAAGPDPERILAVLRAAADREPTTQERPAPEAFVTGLLANGYTVVVRAWTGRFEDWIEVRSELNVTLHATLVRENISLI